LGCWERTLLELKDSEKRSVGFGEKIEENLRGKG